MSAVAEVPPSPVAPGGFENHPGIKPWRRFLLGNRAAFGSLLVFVLMMVTFIIYGAVIDPSSTTFYKWDLYKSVLTILPVALFLVVPLVFIVTSGEIDLSFPAVMGLSGWVFAIAVQAGFNPLLAMLGGIAAGLLLGLLVGLVVV
jgi:ribose/xylose/arabinose/galactoside ABC-type transport system permease subunit